MFSNTHIQSHTEANKLVSYYVLTLGAAHNAYHAAV